MKKSFIVIGVILLASTLLAAETKEVPAKKVVVKTKKEPVNGAYVGLGLGTTVFSDGGYTSDINKMYAASSQTGYKTDYVSAGAKLYGGYQFNRIVGVEISYTNYGSYLMSRNTTRIELNPNSLSLAANLGYSFGQTGQYRPFGLVGLSVLNHHQGGNTKLYASNSGGAVKFGFGFEYTPIKHLGLRLAYEGDFYVMADANPNNSAYLNESYTNALSMLYAGVCYKF